MKTATRHPLGAGVLLRLRAQRGSTTALAEEFWRHAPEGRDHLDLTGSAEDLLSEAWDRACEEAHAVNDNPPCFARVFEDSAVQLIVLTESGLRYSAEWPDLFTCHSRREFEAVCEHLVRVLIQHV